MFQSHLLFKSSVLILFLTILISCNTNQTHTTTIDLNAPTSDSLKEAMINNNRAGMQQEANAITIYVKKRGWNMNTSGTGLRYEIYHEGAGKSFPKKGDFATVAYTLSLLDGTMISNVTTINPEIFQIGKASVPRGLEEGITFMKAGDKAHLVLPKHLAFGLVGDDKKIPSNSILCYDVELVSVK